MQHTEQLLARAAPRHLAAWTRRFLLAAAWQRSRALLLAYPDETRAPGGSQLNSRPTARDAPPVNRWPIFWDVANSGR